MANTSALDVVATMTTFFAANGSLNLYMAHGGTNWGFTNGANGGGTSFQPVITSYDYSAPLAEGGGHGYAVSRAAAAGSTTGKLRARCTAPDSS
jgi:hypothetical protein